MLKYFWLSRAWIYFFLPFGLLLKKGMFVKKIVNAVSEPTFGLFCVAIDQFTDSVTSRKNLVTHNVFSWGSGLLSQYKQNFTDLYCFSHFSRIFLWSCIRCLFEQYTMKLSVYLRKLSDNNVLFFLFNFERYLFGLPHRLRVIIFNLDAPCLIWNLWWSCK